MKSATVPKQFFPGKTPGNFKSGKLEKSKSSPVPLTEFKRKTADPFFEHKLEKTKSLPVPINNSRAERTDFFKPGNPEEAKSETRKNHLLAYGEKRLAKIDMAAELVARGVPVPVALENMNLEKDSPLVKSKIPYPDLEKALAPSASADDEDSQEGIFEMEL